MSNITWEAIKAGKRESDGFDIQIHCKCGRDVTILARDSTGREICKACATEAMQAIDKCYQDNFQKDFDDRKD